MQLLLIFSPAPFSPLNSTSPSQLAYSGLVPNTKGNGLLPSEFCFWQIFSFVSCIKLTFITLLWGTFEHGLLRELLPALMLFFFFRAPFGLLASSAWFCHIECWCLGPPVPKSWTREPDCGCAGAYSESWSFWPQNRQTPAAEAGVGGCVW